MSILRTIAAAALAAVLIAGCGGSSSSSSGTTSSPSHSGSQTPAAVAQSTTSTTTPSSSSSSTTSTTSATSATSTTSTASAFSTTATLAQGFHLSSPAFAAGAKIPATNTCDGSDVSPPLKLTGIPPGTRELVLVMRDPDAPGGNFVHWALAGIPPTTGSLPSGGVPGLVVPGRNSFGTLGYRGPCPPPRATPHHYVLTMSALPLASGLRAGFQADQLQSTAIGIATLIGTYARR